jgi:hypothetical protein
MLVGRPPARPSFRPRSMQGRTLERGDVYSLLAISNRFTQFVHSLFSRQPAR